MTNRCPDPDGQPTPDWSAWEASAQGEFDNNKRKIDAGETYAAHKPPERRRRPGPNGGGRVRKVG